MTYLEIANKILRLLREDTVTTLQGADDVVVGLVKEYINDAKKIVEEAHSWNVLRDSWSLSTLQDVEYVSVTGAGKEAIIETVFCNGNPMKETTNRRLAELKAGSSDTSTPTYYAVSGVDVSGDIRFRLHPTPDAAHTIAITGYSGQADLSADADVIKVPYQPVVYYAYALAARERGEVGGQTAAEIFAMASQYLSDAIANDAAMNNLEYEWYVG